MDENLISESTQFQYFSVFLQYFASKISTCTEESVWLEVLFPPQRLSHWYCKVVYQEYKGEYLAPSENYWESNPSATFDLRAISPASAE